METKPVVGMGATMYVGTDRYPYTVTEVSKSGKQMLIQQDEFSATTGHDFYGVQKYCFTPNPKGPVVKVRWNERLGWWRACNCKSLVSLGHRDAYMDPSF